MRVSRSSVITSCDFHIQKSVVFLVKVTQNTAQALNLCRIMSRCSCQPHPLGPFWDGWVIDGLDIDVMGIKEPIGDGFAANGISDYERNNMAFAFHEGKSQLIECGFEFLDVAEDTLALGG